MKIQNVYRVTEGGRLYWQAELVVGTDTFRVDTKHGAWEVVQTVDGHEQRRHVLRGVAEDLQEQVHHIERTEARSADQ